MNENRGEFINLAKIGRIYNIWERGGILNMHHCLRGVGAPDWKLISDILVNGSAAHELSSEILVNGSAEHELSSDIRVTPRRIVPFTDLWKAANCHRYSARCRQRCSFNCRRLSGDLRSGRNHRSKHSSDDVFNPSQPLQLLCFSPSPFVLPAAEADDDALPSQQQPPRS